MSGDQDDPLVDTLLGDQQRDQIETYAARGRPFQPLTVDALSHAWAAACIDVAFGDDGQLVELSFLAAELVARDLHPPEELVPPQARQALHGRIASSRRRASRQSPTKSAGCTNGSRINGGWARSGKR